jgi:hypothetical protein
MLAPGVAGRYWRKGGFRSSDRLAVLDGAGSSVRSAGGILDDGGIRAY